MGVSVLQERLVLCIILPQLPVEQLVQVNYKLVMATVALGQERIRVLLVPLPLELAMPLQRQLVVRGDL